MNVLSVVYYSMSELIKGFDLYCPLQTEWSRFGHEDSVTGIDSLSRDRAVTCGGRDRTLRVWKVVEESQLVFNAQGNL